VVLLANEGANSVFATDNLNLKILTTLTNHEAYWQHLVQHQIRKQPIKCGVELSSELQSRTVALSLTAYGSESLFSVNTPGNVIGRVLSRSIIDIVYYKIFLEIFSFHGHAIYFVDPHQFAAHGVAPGMSFESLSRGFSQGLLIGFSQIEAAGVSLRLVPSGQVLAPNDWLIVIARNPEALVFDPTPASQPAFLHADCRASLREAHFVFPTIEQYFEPAFVSRLHAGAYDTIIINLEDDPGFRFTLFILAQFPSNDPFLAKIITVLTDPVLEGLLNEHAKYRNTILSDKLAAKYTTQLLFQKNLEHLYNELSAPEGAEFNLLDVGVHIPRNFLTTKQAVKDLLLTHGLVYVGTVDQQKDVHIDADRFEGVHQLVVISHGEY
jgi:hypothetical protein